MSSQAIQRSTRVKRTHRVRERESTRRKRRRRRRRRRQRRGRRRAVHFFLNRARVPFGFWKNEKRERKTIQTTHQFILLLVFVSRACDDTTTTTEARWSFSLSRFSLLCCDRRHVVVDLFSYVTSNIVASQTQPSSSVVSVHEATEVSDD